MSLESVFKFSCCLCVGKEVKSRFSHLEKSSLNFSSSRFVIRVNLLHSKTHLLPDGLSTRKLTSANNVSIFVTPYMCHVLIHEQNGE